MRGGAHVKEALGFVTLLWNHPVLTGLLLLVFTPPFFPLLVYFSPLLMSTALCVVALVSVGSQMEKIKAEGPGQLESHLGQDHGVSRWVPRENRSGSESMERHHYGHRENHRNLYSRSDININVVPAPPSWTGANSGHELATRARAQLRPEPVEDHPPTPPAEESDEDWWDNWVKEYESRPGWGEQEDQALRTAPAIRTSTTSQTVSQEPAPPTIPMHATVRQERHQDVPLTTPRKPTRQETREEKPSPAPVEAPVAAPVTAPIVHSVAASVTAPVSVAVVNRQEVLRSFPPLPTTSNSRTSAEEIVVAVKDSDLRPHISLAPIRTGREKRDVRQVDRIHGKPAAQASEIQEVAPARSVDVERVSDVQALQSIEKLLHIEMCRSNATTPPSSLSKNVVDVKNAGLGNSSGVNLQVSVAREAVSPQLNVTKGSESVVSTGKGIAVEASKKNRNKIAVGAVAPPPPPTPEAAVEDIAGETPLLRHLRTSRSEKQARGVAYSPLPARTSKGLMSEKVLPPPQFSPRLLQSLQPLPPRGFSPRLPNLSTVPLGNPVEKIPQWVYDGIPRERAETQDVKQAETAEEKHIRAFEKAISDLSEARRKKHARRPAPIQVDSATLQSRRDVSTPNRPSLTPVEATLARIRKERTPEQKSSRVSSHRSASRGSSPRRSSPAESVVAEILPTHILEDVAVGQGHGHESSSLHSTEMAPATVPTPRASAAFPSAMVAASPHKASIAATIRRASTAASPQPAPIAASPRPPSPQPASIAASPRPAAAASSPQKALVAASPRRASRASSPHKPSIVSGAPWPASNAASTQRASVASSPQRASVAASPRPPSRAPPVASSPHERSSVPSSPSMSSHPRRRRHSSKHCTDKVAFIRIEGSTYYDPPSAAEKEKLLAAEESAAAPSEEYVPIEEEVMTILPAVGVKDDEIAQSHCLTPRASEPTQPGSFPEEETAALRWGRSHSTTRKSRRRLEPRRVVTSEDTDIFSLKKSFSTRSGETKKFVDSSSDDERESVTPRASRRSMGRAIKPLVWRSRSVQAHEDSD